MSRYRVGWFSCLFDQEPEVCWGHGQNRGTQGRYFSVDPLPEATLKNIPHLPKGFSHHPWLKEKGQQNGRTSAAELLTTVQTETVLEWMPPLTLSLERAISSALIEKCLSSRGKSACGRQSVFQEQTSPTSWFAVRASHPPTSNM